ncbi:MAG: AAA family ATPase, partial [Ilumatobacter sp.]
MTRVPERGATDAIAAGPDEAIGSTETHISRLWLSPDRVYKMLKPVEFGFLDLSDRSDRLAAADRELELNRRFAPDVYLGSADVVEEGDTVERMIVMRRLPADRRLSAIVHDPDFDACLRSIARQVAGFHSAAEPVVDAPMATRDRVEANWTSNFLTLEAHVGTIIDRDEYDRVRHLATRYLAGRADLFDARIAEGFVVDGHGDLTADDIYCLADGPRLLDCLAFDDDLRIADVLADIGFLVMDVHRLAGRRAAVLLMDAYHQFSNEQHPSTLAHHYVAYRAHVRAKIACLRVAQGDTTQVELARTYHHLALHHLERSQVRMVLVGGGPGVGKTTVASALAGHTGYIHLSSDEIRRDVAGTAPGEHHFVEPGTGMYTPEAVADNYRELEREAGILLAAGNGVVLDASWSREE